jgi:hypothetical protein
MPKNLGEDRPDARGRYRAPGMGSALQALLKRRSGWLPAGMLVLVWCPVNFLRSAHRFRQRDILTGIASLLRGGLWLTFHSSFLLEAPHVTFRSCGSLYDASCRYALRYRAGGTSSGRCL